MDKLFTLSQVCLSLVACTCLLRSLRARTPLHREHEQRLVPLKLSRLVTFALLAFMSGAAACLRLLHPPPAPTPSLGGWDAAQLQELAMLATWLLHVVRELRRLMFDCSASSVKSWKLGRSSLVLLKTVI
jgi:hypothetical protein